MRNLQDIFETSKQSFISAVTICKTVPLKNESYFFLATLFRVGFSSNKLYINSYHGPRPILLETSEHVWFSYVLRGS